MRLRTVSLPYTQMALKIVPQSCALSIESPSANGIVEGMNPRPTSIIHVPYPCAQLLFELQHAVRCTLRTSENSTIVADHFG